MTDRTVPVEVLSPLTEDEQAMFEDLGQMAMSTLDDSENGLLGLMRCRLDGADVAVVAWVLNNEDGTQDVYPMAVLVNDNLFSRLQRPENHSTDA